MREAYCLELKHCSAEAKKGEKRFAFGRYFPCVYADHYGLLQHFLILPGGSGGGG